MAPVPKYSEIGQGVLVEIVLKADQSTGKLTRGKVADILTRGDHPRGVKVRLESGLIGRVQSLAPASNDSPPGINQASPSIHDDGHREDGSSKEFTVTQKFSSRTQNYRFQEDFRKTEPPVAEAVSLTDFMKPTSRNKHKKSRKLAAVTNSRHISLASNNSEQSSERVIATTSDEHISDQTRLETEFPKLDSALIAAILGDCTSIQEVRSILLSLS
jgi:uncharacterized repeat protein (TIGR03833 family)